jgi:hypothetical protein
VLCSTGPDPPTPPGTTDGQLGTHGFPRVQPLLVPLPLARRRPEFKRAQLIVLRTLAGRDHRCGQERGGGVFDGVCSARLCPIEQFRAVGRGVWGVVDLDRSVRVGSEDL